MKPPLITISIISHGDAPKVAALLRSLCQYQQEGKYQILITDNLDSEDFNDEIFQKTTIFRNKTPKGFAENHNTAFTHALGEYFCVLNPDILFTQPLFKALIQKIDGGQADILAPLIVNSHGIVQDSFRSLPTPGELILRRFGMKRPVQKPRAPISPDWLAGMFLFMRTETFHSLGGFDERYHLYFEDVDFGTRARLAGYRLLLDSSLEIQHDAHRGSRYSLRYLSWHLQSAWKFFTSETYKKAK